MRFLVCLGFFALALAACTMPPRVDVPAGTPPLVLEEYFRGRTTAEGTFTNFITGEERAFTVALNGRWDGEKLTLVEDFIFADGERDRKTWIFTKVSANRYTGTREDVVGTADIRVEGSVATISYLIDLPNNGRTTRVRFEDILALQPGGVLINRARVSKFGAAIGAVDLTFRRGR